MRHKITRAVTKVLDREKGLVSAVMSTEAPDRDGDVIRVDGWDLSDFERHPVLLADHNYFSIESQIGEWHDVEVTRAKGPSGSNQLVGVAKYYVGEGNAKADWAFNLTEKGRAAYSVGFIPDMEKAVTLDGGDDMWGPFEFRGQKLLETSQVTVPANQEALQRMKAASVHPVIDELINEVLADDNNKQAPAYMYDLDNLDDGLRSYVDGEIAKIADLIKALRAERAAPDEAAPIITSEFIDAYRREINGG